MEPDIRQALRFLGIHGEPDRALMDELNTQKQRLTRSVTPRYLFRVFPVSLTDGGPELTGSGLTLPGTLAERMLSGCSRAALLLCTLGSGFDAMLRAEQARSMARAVMLDALGSAYVEAGCDAAEAELRGRFPELYLTDRFSPGYGDLPLSLQRDLCAVLDGEKRLGVTVNDSLLMNPAKTVSAVIGLGSAPQPARIRGCAHCALRESCTYRKGGTTCVSGSSEE